MFSFFGRIKRQIYHERHQMFVARVMHDEVLEHVSEEGGITPRYVFMALMSCGIALLGLLQSSPAVVIGAMLISPLMSPIMSFGFSLCVLNEPQMVKSLKAIFVGVVLSIGVAYFIVLLSPLNDATPEIMARTRPNLFDLAIAIFSGLAGGYAVVKRKGETIVGVAIATALMPPLAVTGYGLAVEDFAIAQGSFFLFMTNLLAIAFCVTAIAKWYGFGGYSRSKHTWWQTILILLVFGMLSLPLGISLKQIAYEASVTKLVRGEIKREFKGHESRIDWFDISFPSGKNIAIDSVILTRKFRDGAGDRIKARIENELGKEIIFDFDQIELSKGQTLDNVSKIKLSDNTLQARKSPVKNLHDYREDMAKQIRNVMPLPIASLELDMAGNKMTLYPEPIEDMGLVAFMTIEQTLKSRFPAWKVEVIPPVRGLPYIYFGEGEDIAKDRYARRLNAIIWALGRWKVVDVEVVGFASTVGEFGRFDNTSLAYRRAKSVMNALKIEGFSVRHKAEYVSYLQRQNEKSYGTNSFQRVEIRLAALPEVMDDEMQSKDAVQIQEATPNSDENIAPSEMNE